MDDAYYSALEKVLAEAPMESAPLQGWLDYLQGKVNSGEVKADELLWTDIAAKLREAAQDGKRLAKDAVVDIAEAAAVVVETITADGIPEWEVYTYNETYYFDTEEEAWENYRYHHDYLEKGDAVQIAHDDDNITVYDEVDDWKIESFRREKDDIWRDSEDRPYHSLEAAMQQAEQLAQDKREYYLDYLRTPSLSEDGDIRYGEPRYAKYSFAPLGAYPYSETLLTLSGDTVFVPGHWPVGNVLAHIRTTKFWGGDNTTLFVEELQSDWAQARRRSSHVAQAPFTDGTQKWVTLALKKVLHQAVEEEVDVVAFINGKQSAGRYELEKEINEVQLFSDNSKYYLILLDDSGREWRTIQGRAHAGSTIIETANEDELLPAIGRVIGKELAERLLEQEPRDEHRLRGLKGVELTIGGEGMKAFYDGIVPASLKALLKKIDPSVTLEPVHCHETGEAQLGFRLTDTIREKVLAGQALFSFAPPKEEGKHYSLNEANDSPFALAVDEIVNGSESYRFIPLGRTPDVLKLLGVPDQPFSIHTSVIEKAMAEYLGIAQRSRNAHNVTPEALKALPAEINDPVAIFSSTNPRTGEPAFVVLTTLYEHEYLSPLKKPLIAALHMEESKSGLQLVNVKSVYGRSLAQIQRAIESDTLYWHSKKGRQLAYGFRLRLPSAFHKIDDLSDANIKTEHDLCQARHREAKAYLDDKLGLDASRLITLTDRLPDGTPLLGEGIHLRGGKAHGQTCINPDLIHPLYDGNGKEMLSRNERLLWVAHHELFHRGVSVVGAEKLRTALEAADRNPFIASLANALSAERRILSPENSIPRTLAVEEALAELHAARESNALPALITRYRQYAPDLELPMTQGGWRGRIQAYLGDARQVLSRLCGRDVALNDAQIFRLVDRVGQAARQEIPASRGQTEHLLSRAKAPIELPDLRGLSPREAGKVVYASLSGDLSNLPQIKSALAEQGLQLDERHLKSIPNHPDMARDAFLRAVVRHRTTASQITK